MELPLYYSSHGGDVMKRQQNFFFTFGMAVIQRILTQLSLSDGSC